MKDFLPVGPLTRTELANGLQVWTQPTATATVTIAIVINAGSFRDGDHLGIAHLTEHMVFKGTRTRDVNAINETIEESGGLINAETSFDYTRYYCTLPADAWTTGLDVLCELVWTPRLPAKELISERVVVQEEIRMYHDDAASYASELLFNTMNAGHPTRQGIAGTIASVGAIERPDLLAFMARYYVPNNMAVIITGQIKHAEVVRFLQQRYNQPSGVAIAPLAPFPVPTLTSSTAVEPRQIEQAHLSWGLFTVPEGHADSEALRTLATLLGGTMSSRLYRLIREERGLAYTVTTEHMGLSDSGFLIGYTGLAADKLGEVTELIIQETERLAREAVTSAELERIKHYRRGTTLINLERTSALNHFLSDAFIYHTTTDPNEALQRLYAVTPSDIARVAATYFTPDNWQFVHIVPSAPTP